MITKRIHKRHRYYLRETSYLQRVCNKVNTLVPCKDDSDVMGIIREMMDYNPRPYNFDVYWNRDLYMRCDFHSDKAWDVFLHTELTEAVVSDDMQEHPGIVIQLKQES